MMENLFDCLCSLLLHNPNRDRFLKGEGLQLMNLMLREKKVPRLLFYCIRLLYDNRRRVWPPSVARLRSLVLGLLIGC